MVKKVKIQRKWKVLVVEDDDFTRLGIIKTLEKTKNKEVSIQLCESLLMKNFFVLQLRCQDIF